MTEAILLGQYDWRLVGLSIAIACTASYAALDLTGRTAHSEGRSRALWLTGGANAMGLGIWAMHYIGMLAFQLPVPVLYDVPIVLFSLFAAVVSSAVALFVVSRKQPSQLSLIAGSLAMGGGIAAMHYSGMQAMRLTAQLVYSPALVSLSIGIAVAVSYVALRIAIRLLDPARNPPWVRFACSAVMGLAIAAMHYTGMAAVCFHHAHLSARADHAVNVSSLGIVGITAVTFAVLALSLVGALADRRFSLQRDMLLAEQERWRLMISANQDGLFDVDLLKGVVFYSPRWAEILGYRSEELTPDAETWRQRLHPDERRNVEQELDAYLQSRDGVFQMEYRLLHRDGSWRWVLARAQGVWNANGRPIRLVGSHADITNQKRALSELQASEARFSAFMSNNPSMTCMKDADGRMVYTNPKLEQMFQLQPGEWIGKTDHDIWPKDLADRVRQIDLEVMASGQSQEMVNAALTPDGIVRQFLTTKFSFEDGTGKTAIGAVATDITDRVANEQRIQNSEARYRELFEHNPVPSWIYTTSDLRIVDVNEAAIHHYGWSREEFIGLNVGYIRMSGEVEQIEAELRDCSAGYRRTKPLLHRRNNKSAIWVELSSHEIEAAGVAARLTMASDVTDRVEAGNQLQQSHDQMESLVAQRTAELQKSEAKWRELIESLPQFVWSTQPDGFCDFLSEQWTEYTGVPASQLLGSGWLNTLHPDDLERVATQRLGARSDAEAFEFEYRIRAKNGSYRWFVSRGRPVHAVEGGPITQWVGTTTDIEDQKRSEERLEAAVAQRTVELAEARDRAECAARAKSSFLAAMSHEIRTPMNGIIGMTGLVLDTSLTSEQRCYLDIVRSSGEALLGIINDVLDFSKIEAGKMDLENVEFDLQTVLEEALELVTPTAIKKGLKVSMVVGDDVPASIIGDSGRLRQVLLNLLSNAVKFTEVGSILISVSRETAQDRNFTLRVAVRDTGIGITAEQQRGLFQAFSQADRSTTRRFGGTGLGLSIAKRLVELMGGKIGASSQIGQGTTFWFNIVVAEGVAQPASIAASGHILLIAEVGPSRTTIKSHLERGSLKVLERSLVEAQSTISCDDRGVAAGSVSLVVIDCAILRSAAELDRLRMLPQLASCPFLMLGTPVDWSGTDFATPGNRDIYVTKPVRCVPLLNAVRSAISGRSSLGRANDVNSSPISLSGAKILLVEDNRVNQVLARVLLERLGCHVEIASNGLDACAAIERQLYDLVLMDCQMPGMDGFEATRIIREREKGTHRTPIVALTAGVLQEERERCYAAGMDDFLSKPIAKKDLETTLVSWLAKVQT